jgi:hypothetical protein
LITKLLAGGFTPTDAEAVDRLISTASPNVNVMISRPGKRLATKCLFENPAFLQRHVEEHRRILPAGKIIDRRAK